MNRKEREELNELSKLVFGSSSKWQKLVNRGINEPYERDREVMIPTKNGRFTKKVFTDRKNVLKRYSVEEVRNLMQDMLLRTTAGEKILNALHANDLQTVTLDPSSSLVSSTPVSGSGIPEGSTVA